MTAGKHGAEQVSAELLFVLCKGSGKSGGWGWWVGGVIGGVGLVGGWSDWRGGAGGWVE